MQAGAKVAPEVLSVERLRLPSCPSSRFATGKAFNMKPMLARLNLSLSWRLREKCHRKTGKSLSPLFSSNPEDKVRITEVVGSNLNARS
jgi:hypothetical protein